MKHIIIKYDHRTLYADDIIQRTDLHEHQTIRQKLQKLYSDKSHTALTSL